MSTATQAPLASVAAPDGSNSQQLSCSRVILELLTALPGHRAPVAVLIRACDVFGFDQNAVRVALTRLRQREKLQSPERGVYELGPATRSTTDWITQWRSRHTYLCPWHDDWLYVAPLPGRRRPGRAADQWLQLRGFRRFNDGLWLRPANLSRPWQRLGDPPLPCLTGMLAVDTCGEQDRLHGLWAQESWPTRLAAMIEELETTRPKLARMPAAAAAQTAFLTGSKAISLIVREPLLPDTWVDPRLRRRLIDTMTAFDDLGKQLWLRLLTDSATPGAVGNDRNLEQRNTVT